MARGYGGLSGQVDYSQVDRLRAQLMEAVNRQNQYDTMETATFKNELENRAIGNILSEYSGEVAPKVTAPARDIEAPTGYKGFSLPAPGLPGVSLPIPTGVATRTLHVPALTEEATRETQYDAAAKAFSRLSMYGQKGLNVAKQLQENLSTYARLFPYQKPVYPEELLGVTKVKSETGDEAGIARFGYMEPKTGQPFVTGHAVINFNPPSGAGKGENFYGTAFKYGNQADPNMPTGVNPDFDQKERIKVEAQLGSEEDRVIRLYQTAQQNLSGLEQKQSFERLYPEKLRTVTPDQLKAQQQVVDDANRRLKYIRAHKDILHKTFDLGKGGGNPDKGAGIRKGKKGAGHTQAG